MDRGSLYLVFLQLTRGPSLVTLNAYLMNMLSYRIDRGGLSLEKYLLLLFRC